MNVINFFTVPFEGVITQYILEISTLTFTNLSEISQFTSHFAYHRFYPIQNILKNPKVLLITLSF